MMSFDHICTTRTACAGAVWPQNTARRIIVAPSAAKNSTGGPFGRPADGQQQERSHDPAAANGGTAATDGTARPPSGAQMLLSAVKPAAGSASWRPDARVMFASKLCLHRASCLL